MDDTLSNGIVSKSICSGIIDRMEKMVFVLFMLFPSLAFAALSDADITGYERELENKPVGERIAFWAEKFVETPYDPDPLGEYVRENVIIADERVDCMYLTFRAVELGIGRTPADALRVALDKRFVRNGKIEDGKVVNYEDRFQYGEDMLDSGKWGREITGELGERDIIEGARGRQSVAFLAPGRITEKIDLLRSGDIIFFINGPEKMASGGIVGHMGIIKKEGDLVYLIHASGIKNKGGKVKKVLFLDYMETMPFIGVRISRFEPVREVSR